MQMRRPLQDVLYDIRQWREDSGWSPAKIAQRAGVNLATVYRVLDEDAMREKLGAAIKRICKIAKVPVDVARDGEIPVELKTAVLEAWDGTPEHGRQLARAIRALGGLARTALRSK